jgi:hypothetical protein
MDIALTLSRKFPGAVWTLNGDDYEGLDWLSDTPKPTKKELDDLWNEVKSEIKAEAEARATQKAALLERLGISEDEARLLLA